MSHLFRCVMVWECLQNSLPVFGFKTKHCKFKRIWIKIYIINFEFIRSTHHLHISLIKIISFSAILCNFSFDYLVSFSGQIFNQHHIKDFFFKSFKCFGINILNLISLNYLGGSGPPFPSRSMRMLPTKEYIVLTPFF